jgi:hypothetical protein
MNYLSLFIHTEWTDLCIYDQNNYIKRKSIDDEVGNYKIINNEFIINWEKWKGDDIFIKISDKYIHKKFYEKYIKNYKIIKINIYIDNSVQNFYINTDLNVIFKKNNLVIFGYYLINDNSITITFNNISEKTYINLDNIYYEQEYITNLFNNYDNLHIRKEKFKKINNNYYSNNLIIEHKTLNKVYDIINNSDFDFDLKNNILNTIKNKYSHILDNLDKKNKTYQYSIIDLNINNSKINNILKSIINNNVFVNKNYLNIYNINEHLNININDNILDEITKLEINFKINKKIKKRVLSLVQWGYPPFGGGENWILNMNKILNNNNFETYMICFGDPFLNEYYTTTNYIDLEYVKIIQTSFETLNIIKLIKVIDPDIINHQGVNRLFFMKLSNILNIPFFTGFCFWQDIIKFNMDNINVNMIENSNLEKTDNFEFIINNSYTYVSSEFVNDIIFKLYNKKLDVIETISVEDEFKVEYINKNNFNNRIYVTLINCHYNKGGYLIKYLCNNLDYNIGLQFVYTENDPNVPINLVEELISNRNKVNNINIVYSSKIDIKIIYNNTRILLLPSLCDETFCRVGYEGLVNKIPIISTKNGNLKYLLNNYAIFVNDYDVKEWRCQIEKLYYDEENIISLSNKNIKCTKYNIVEKQIINKFNNIKKSKYNLYNNNIGLIIPWADQGLGIQSRDYYITLKKLGYNPHIYSFKPYHSTADNRYLQTNSNEWDYDNIVYSDNYREDLNYNEILDFIYRYNIKKIIVIEATFLNIFKISLFLKILNIKIYLVVNIECIRLVELNYHNIFDYLISNNNESHLILSNLFKDKVKYLGFHLNHPYFKDINKSLKENLNNIKFCCVGGLNSISRKNIDLVIKSFYNIFINNKYLNWELNVYIQGVEIPEIINNYKCTKINYFIEQLTYKDIVQKYIENDIFIHMGSHEGLGLGFYESIYCGTPILTMNWTPNNEIIHDNINGWLLDCNFSNIYDNNNSLINKGIINEENLVEKIIDILNDNNTLNIINNTIINKNILNDKNKNIFEKNMNDILLD